MTVALRTVAATLLSAVAVALGVHLLMTFAKPAPTNAKALGRAPDFSLTAQNGRDFDFDETRGVVVALSFVFTRCTDLCPIATFKLSWIQNELGEAFGSEAIFVTVTVDPEYDTVETLAEYASFLEANLAGWTFLTGDPDAVRQVAENYGVYVRSVDDVVEHILLTSLIDRNGVIRVQYLGERFDAQEMLTDIRQLIGEVAAG